MQNFGKSLLLIPAFWRLKYNSICSKHSDNSNKAIFLVFTQCVINTSNHLLQEYIVEIKILPKQLPKNYHEKI